MSTTEAEYIAIAELLKEAKWVKGLVGEMCPKMSLVRVHCDSESAIHLARNQKFSSKNQEHRYQI